MSRQTMLQLEIERQKKDNPQPSSLEIAFGIIIGGLFWAIALEAVCSAL